MDRSKLLVWCLKPRDETVNTSDCRRDTALLLFLILENVENEMDEKK